MKFQRLVAVFGLCVSMVGCGTQQEQPEGGEALVPVSEAPELHQDGASITIIEGLMPMLVPGSVRDGAAETPAGEQVSQEPGTVSAMSESLNQWGSFAYSGGTWGRSYETVVGTSCNGGHIRTRAVVFNSGRGNCGFVRWNSGSPTDCRMVVHVGVPSFTSGACQWEAWARPPTNVCGNNSCESSEGENVGNCPQDCDYCGNGFCGSFEDVNSCINDCGYCGDEYCAANEQGWCYTDCGSSCGGRFCEEPL